MMPYSPRLQWVPRWQWIEFVCQCERAGANAKDVARALDFLRHRASIWLYPPPAQLLKLANLLGAVISTLPEDMRKMGGATSSVKSNNANLELELPLADSDRSLSLSLRSVAATVEWAADEMAIYVRAAHSIEPEERRCLAELLGEAASQLATSPESTVCARIRLQVVQGERRASRAPEVSPAELPPEGRRPVGEASSASPWMTPQRLRAVLRDMGVDGQASTEADALVRRCRELLEMARGSSRRGLPHLGANQPARDNAKTACIDLDSAEGTARYLLNMLLIRPGTDPGSTEAERPVGEQRLTFTLLFLENDREVSLKHKMRVHLRQVANVDLDALENAKPHLYCYFVDRLQIQYYKRFRCLEVNLEAQGALAAISRLVVLEAMFGGKFPSSWPAADWPGKASRGSGKVQSSRITGEDLKRRWSSDEPELVPELQILLRLLEGKSVAQYARMLVPSCVDIIDGHYARDLDSVDEQEERDTIDEHYAREVVSIDQEHARRADARRRRALKSPPPGDLAERIRALQVFEWGWGEGFRPATAKEVASLRELDDPRRPCRLLRNCLRAVPPDSGKRRTPAATRRERIFALLGGHPRPRYLSELSRRELLSLVVHVGFVINRPATEVDALWVADATSHTALGG